MLCTDFLKAKRKKSVAAMHVFCLSLHFLYFYFHALQYLQLQLIFPQSYRSILYVYLVIPNVHKMVKHTLQYLAEFFARFWTCVWPFCGHQALKGWSISMNVETQMIFLRLVICYTAQKMKFSVKDFFIKCDQIRSFLWIYPHFSLMENFITVLCHSSLIVPEINLLQINFLVHFAPKFFLYSFDFSLFLY